MSLSRMVELLLSRKMECVVVTEGGFVTVTEIGLSHWHGGWDVIVTEGGVCHCHGECIEPLGRRVECVTVTEGGVRHHHGWWSVLLSWRVECVTVTLSK